MFLRDIKDGTTANMNMKKKMNMSHSRMEIILTPPPRMPTVGSDSFKVSSSVAALPIAGAVKLSVALPYDHG